MATTYDLDFALGTGEDDPTLVFWKRSLEPGDGSEWLLLESHDCNGFAIDYLGGYVIGLQPDTSVLPLLRTIADEDFCSSISQVELKRSNADSLDYGVEDPHRRAYAAFLAVNGLEAGSLELLQQAVYPLAASRANLGKLGVNRVTIPVGACLAILGWNCD